MEKGIQKLNFKLGGVTVGICGENLPWGGLPFRSSANRVILSLLLSTVQEAQPRLAAVEGGSIGDVPILLAKPQTYMNFSGESEAQPLLAAVEGGENLGLSSIGDVPILLAKPQTYMNFSGESIGPLLAYYQVPLRHILVVYDEMSLPNGVLRLQPKGGHGYDNGNA
ncbi:uncharacterized protein LOC107486786 [Arachis duranensis]|uniref:Uncharacterized protein LOC107486786 n=1 Tax=Arachis duranensis TaxID=130453 RepID=A0A9C6TGR3_ARADU|nr:uncharacterized protein LOC107486786 [Arachis duranensis]